jgi:hypothetical protein
MMILLHIGAESFEKIAKLTHQNHRTSWRATAENAKIVLLRQAFNRREVSRNRTEPFG